MISSDHIPAILNKDIQYKFDKHVNISLLIYKGKSIDISTKHQYEVPWFIWDLISDKNTTRNYDIKILEKLYYKSLNESLDN